MSTKAPPEPAAADQAALDLEDAKLFRRQLAKLAADADAKKEREAHAKQAARAAKKELKRADAELWLAVRGDRDDDPTYFGRVREYSLAASAASDRATETRQAWVLAVAARRRAQEELRAAVRR